MGDIIRGEPRPNWLPPSSPEALTDADGIPDDALRVMDSVGAPNNPHLILDARFVARYQTAPIPETVELIPTVQRIPLGGDFPVT